MSVWIDVKEQLPPLNEKVLILYKDKTDELKEENLFYGLSSLLDINFDFERWSFFTEYQGYYEVVFWARLYDMPHLDNKEIEE